MIKLDFTFVTLVFINCDINLKLNKALNIFMKGSNWYPQMIMGIVDVKELTSGITRSSVNMECPSSIVIKVSVV